MFGSGRQLDSTERDSLTGTWARRREIGPAASLRWRPRAHALSAAELRARPTVTLRSRRAKASRAWSVYIWRSVASFGALAIGMLARALGAGKALGELRWPRPILFYPLNGGRLARIVLPFSSTASVLGPEAVAIISVVGALAALNAVAWLRARLSTGEALPGRGLRRRIAVVASGLRRIVVGHVGITRWGGAWRRTTRGE
jgi:hypothetical protein